MFRIRISFLCGLCALFCLVSCTEGARVDGRLAGADSGEVVFHMPDGAAWKAVDTVKVSRSGKYSCRLKVAAGQPEFAYLSYGGRQIASLILRAGDRIRLVTDTLGTLTSLSGSPESALLHEADSSFSAFTARTRGLEGAAFTREYVDFYRKSLSWAIQHSRSLSVVPVLQRKVTPDLPLFGQATDGLVFEMVADSLALTYPESRYVRMLRKEAERRQNAYELARRVATADETAFPDVELPDTRAQGVRLSDVSSPLVMLYFWSTSNEEKMFNLDALIPLYEEFHARGLEIFAVALDPDKAEWAATVKRQGLGWINVCDVRGASSPYIGLYGITQVPMAYFIRNGEIDPDARVTDASSLRTYVSSVLR